MALEVGSPDRWCCDGLENRDWVDRYALQRLWDESERHRGHEVLLLPFCSSVPCNVLRNIQFTMGLCMGHMRRISGAIERQLPLTFLSWE